MRSADINERMSTGHWEADLVQLKMEHGKANLTSLVERRSRYTFLMRNPDRSSAGARDDPLDRIAGSSRDEALAKIALDLAGDYSKWAPLELALIRLA